MAARCSRLRFRPRRPAAGATPCRPRRRRSPLRPTLRTTIACVPDQYAALGSFSAQSGLCQRHDQRQSGPGQTGDAGLRPVDDRHAWHRALRGHPQREDADIVVSYRVLPARPGNGGQLGETGFNYNPRRMLLTRASMRLNIWENLTRGDLRRFREHCRTRVRPRAGHQRPQSRPRRPDVFQFVVFAKA